MTQIQEPMAKILDDTIKNLEDCLRYNQQKGDFIEPELAQNILMRFAHRAHRNHVCKEAEILSELVTIVEGGRKAEARLIIVERFDVVYDKAKARLRELQ